MHNISPNLIEKAKNRVHLAELAKNEGELRYNQAEQAFLKGDYDSCRDYIEKSRAKYNESLLYQESETLRATSDSKLLALGERIIRGENEIVVKEVRELKTKAKNAYYAGNFENAENILNQAKIRWFTTNSEDDPEIESLLSLVGNALSMKTGRTINPTAPLYPEMSQLLNIANQYYNEGKALMSKGKKAEAEHSFESAKEKLREVQTVYPLNQEASLLTLRIDKLIDEKAFTEYFTRKVETAKSDYLDKSKQQTVYTELLDLYEINPSYPGLKDFIYNVEIALGIRVKPPDTSALRKSTQLASEAQKVYDADSRNEISLNRALQLVNQALEANPDNTEAQILKDRISTSLGGTGTAVLPASAEKLYQQAVQELQRGNTIQAYAIVSSLMENKTYKKASKIIDLMKKVESLL
jgi:outer membrane protein assembly factor BamD (BamD/ComL family)